MKGMKNRNRSNSLRNIFKTNKNRVFYCFFCSFLLSIVLNKHFSLVVCCYCCCYIVVGGNGLLQVVCYGWYSPKYHYVGFAFILAVTKKFNRRKVYFLSQHKISFFFFFILFHYLSSSVSVFYILSPFFFFGFSRCTTLEAMHFIYKRSKRRDIVA